MKNFNNKKFLYLIILILNICQIYKLESKEKNNFFQSREDFFPNSCEITTENFHNLPRPKKFFSNNNLLKKSNKIHYAIGQKIIFEGYILDKDCNPIQNAIVRIWHKNNYGFYQENFNFNNIHKDSAYNIQKKLNQYNPSFTGNGTISTDNSGYFQFITINPCLDAKSEIGCIPEIEINVSYLQNNKKIKFDGRVLIPDVDRISSSKIVTLNKYHYDKRYIADLKEFRKEYFRFQYNITLNEKINYRKH
jgi:protocatechuate 3,4-dioxygenase beta subunit